MMNLPGPAFQADLDHIWEDIVDDFLELSSRLLPEERSALLRELRTRDIGAEEIQAYPCFSIDERIVIISDEAARKEFWIVDIKRRKISRHPFTKK